MKRNYIVGGVLITFEQCETKDFVVRLDNARSGSNILTLGVNKEDLHMLKDIIDDVLNTMGVD